MTVTDPDEPRLAWDLPTAPGRQVSGVLLRYRRPVAGVGGEPNLAAGAQEANATTLGWPLHGTGVNEHGLFAENQWHTVRWRRGSLPPFGGDNVPILLTPGTSGNVLSFHLSPDSNCSSGGSNDPECPETLIDFLYVWWEPTGAAAPSFTLAGLRYRVGGNWLPLPLDLPVASDVELAAMIVNTGTAAGQVTPQVTVAITGPEAANLAGSATLNLDPGESGYVAVSPHWQPATAGGYQLQVAASANSQSLGAATVNVTVSATPQDCSTDLIMPTDLVE